MVDRFSRGWNEDRHKGKRIATLWTDGSIDGDVTFSSYFDELSTTAQIDLIGDVIGLLERERKIIMDEVNPSDELCKILGWPLKDER